MASMNSLSAIGNRLFPTDALRRRIMERIRERRGEGALPFRLAHRNIFVLPTAFGLAFGLMLIFMALGGLNFNNNMALLLVFVLGTITVMTTLLTYRNLAGMQIEGIRSEPVFAGEPARFRVFLGNPEPRGRLTVQAGLASGGAQDCRDLAGGTTGSLCLRVPSRRRGWLELPPFRLESRYPLGLFRAWSWFFPKSRCLVYPAPARFAPPLPRTGSGKHGKARKGDGEQVHGLRKYREGDSLRRVAWRTSARHNELYTREMETPEEEACVLSWDLLAGMDTERRLSVLTAWVIQADHRQLTYSLVLPGTATGPGNGPAQRVRCLELLALFGL